MRPRREGGWAVAKIERQAWLCVYDGGKPALFNYDPSDTDSGLYRVLAGPITVTFDVPNACPHCGGALPEAEVPASKAEPFRITGPGLYRTRQGTEALIERHYRGSYPTIFKWEGTEDGSVECWTDDGRYDIDERQSPLDLVERIS